MSTPLPFPVPQPGSVYANMWIAEELSAEQRESLPVAYHRPFFDGLGTPQSWSCEVCWGEGYSTAWPCPTALSDGVELARLLGLGFTS